MAMLFDPPPSFFSFFQSPERLSDTLSPNLHTVEITKVQRLGIISSCDSIIGNSL